jgi:hypothetical protein
VGLFDIGKICCHILVGEVAVHDLGIALGRKVQREAFCSKDFPDLPQDLFRVRPIGVNLVDDDHAAKAGILGFLHHLHRHGFYAIHGTNHHCGGLDGWEHVEGATDEVCEAGGVDDVAVNLVEVEAANGAAQGVTELLGLGVIVGDRGASLDGS